MSYLWIPKVHIPGADLLPDTLSKQQDPRIHPPETGGSYTVSKTSFLGALQRIPLVLGGMEKERKTYFVNVIFVSVQAHTLLFISTKIIAPWLMVPMPACRQQCPVMLLLATNNLKSKTFIYHATAQTDRQSKV